MHFQKWKLAVEKLADKYKTFRMTKVMMPACGWAKDLGLEKEDVKEYLRFLVPKKDFEKDFEKAWKYANCTFRWGDESKSKYENKDYLVEFLKALREGKKSRQEIIKNVFEGQVWLFEEVKERAIEKGYVVLVKEEKKAGKGRKKYYFELAEAGRLFLASLEQVRANGEGKGEVKVEAGGERSYIKKSYITLLEQGVSPDWCSFSVWLGSKEAKETNEERWGGGEEERRREVRRRVEEIAERYAFEPFPSFLLAIREVLEEDFWEQVEEVGKSSLNVFDFLDGFLERFLN